jgi:hypothetical protein
MLPALVRDPSGPARRRRRLALRGQALKAVLAQPASLASTSSSSSASSVLSMPVRSTSTSTSSTSRCARSVTMRRSGSCSAPAATRRSLATRSTASTVPRSCRPRRTRRRRLPVLHPMVRRGAMGSSRPRGHDDDHRRPIRPGARHSPAQPRRGVLRAPLPRCPTGRPKHAASSGIAR